MVRSSSVCAPEPEKMSKNKVEPILWDGTPGMWDITKLKRGDIEEEYTYVKCVIVYVYLILLNVFLFLVSYHGQAPIARHIWSGLR